MPKSHIILTVPDAQIGTTEDTMDYCDHDSVVSNTMEEELLASYFGQLDIYEAQNNYI